jgi:HPt (histidine-containing phosphotransfer) domain-containing protein
LILGELLTSDDEHLRDKARLLLQRERELFDLRSKQDQMSVWLSIGQALPALFSARDGSLARAWDGIRKLMVSRLRVQRVLLLEVHPDELQPLAPAGAARPLTAGARALLAAQATGCCNDPATDAAPGVAALAEVLGLHRFMWSCIARSNQPPILIAAGFDATKAVFQSPFADGDIAHFSNAAQHVQSLLGNALLIAELEGERNQLREANVSLEQRDRELRGAAEHLRLVNESLEQRVRERTQELAGKNRELRLVLDTVDQALLTIDLDGRLAPERSSIADVWFGPYSDRPRFVDHVGAERRFATLFELGLDGLREDVLPRELCLEQMPKRLVRGSRYFDCRYLALEERGQLLGLLLVIDDVTELLTRAREDAEQRELLAAFTGLTRDRNGFFAFFGETERIMAQLTGPLDSALQKRLLHTLKGNAATYGLRLLAELCHQAESDLGRDSAYAETLQELRARWSVIVRTVRTVARTELHRTVEVSEHELAELAERARTGASSSEIVEQLRCLGWESSERSLNRLAEHAQGLAARLGKAGLRVELDADDTRLDPERWAPLWSALVHVIRNAVDHGVESPEERAQQGKSRDGRLRLSARRVGIEYHIAIEDDGRGIDWPLIARRCRERGRASETRADLLAALLSPDFSTRTEISETSGRGIGLSIVAEAVAKLAGQLDLESEPTRGARWRLTFPTSAGCY